MARHTQFHNESQLSANASGDAIDAYLHNAALQEPGFAAAITTDAGYSQLRWLLKTAIEKATAPADDAGLAEAINQMAEDKSNDWTDEIEALEAVERELASLRAQVEQLTAENSIFTTNVGPVEGVELIGRYAKIGQFAAIVLGANEEWDNDDLTEDIAQLWIKVGGAPQLSDDHTALPHWRKLADEHGIAHDGDDDLDDDTCAEEGCDNSLDDGQGYDGYCGDHADQREAAGIYARDDEDDDQ